MEYYSLWPSPTLPAEIPFHSSPLSLRPSGIQGTWGEDCPLVLRRELRDPERGSCLPRNKQLESGKERDCLGLNLSSTTHSLCDPGQITFPL